MLAHLSPIPLLDPFVKFSNPRVQPHVMCLFNSAKERAAGLTYSASWLELEPIGRQTR